MKTITSFLVRFSLLAIVLTIIFRFSLSNGIDNKSVAAITLSAILYGLSMFISGWYFGNKEGEYLPIFDVGFRFHLATYLIHNLISESWFLAGFNSPYEKVGIVHSTTVVWGIFLAFHFIIFMWTRKTAINNLNKKDLFE